MTFVLCLVAPVVPAQHGGTIQSVENRATERPWETIDVAIALDTSQSMQGLIDAARLKLWEIVHDLTLLEPTPHLRVALLTYGGAKNDPRAGWVRIETDLTTDLDAVFERLLSLTSDGGTEYVGRAVHTAVERLSWTPSDDALKLVFVAGNESADQDPQVSFSEVSDAARRESIIVHAVFCGSPGHRDAATWRELAQVAQGEFAHIDHRAGTVVVSSPVDDQLAALGTALNETFIPLGEQGAARRENLVRQDENAVGLGSSAAASRAEVKASPLYSAGWDLVDALEAGTLQLAELDPDALPESLRGLSFTEQQVLIEEMRLRREELRQQILQLSRERRSYVKQQIETRALDDSRAFDTALRRALRERLEEQGFQAPAR